MQATRRDLLKALAVAAVPLTATEVIHDEPHCLSQESAAGYRLFLKNRACTNLQIVPGSRQISQAQLQRLRRAAESGVWLLYESGLCFSAAPEVAVQARHLQTVFDLQIARPIPATDLYIHYTRPTHQMIRAFEAVTPVICQEDEIIARYQGHVVSCRRKIGKGGIIYLGSMLGPALLAGEREAYQLAAFIGGRGQHDDGKF